LYRGVRIIRVMESTRAVQGVIIRAGTRSVDQLIGNRTTEIAHKVEQSL
jgi:phosphopantothenate synthetase